MLDIVAKKRKEIKQLEKRRNELFKLRKPIDNELTSNYKKIDELKNEIGKFLIEQNPCDWTLLLDESSGQSVYDQYVKETRNRGLISGGFLPETGQRCIKVSLTKNDIESYDKTLSALKEILPFIKPLKKDIFKNFKHVSIFEYTHCEHGIYFMLFNEGEKIYKLMFTRYSRTEELKVFDTLEKIIAYVQENHYLSKKL